MDGLCKLMHCGLEKLFKSRAKQALTVDCRRTSLYILCHLFVTIRSAYYKEQS